MADDTILKFRGEIKLDIVKPIDLDIVYEDDNILIKINRQECLVKRLKQVMYQLMNILFLI